ncbi:hypothetical protein EDC35_102156 [Thiobaca trueperi]|uniref:Uncharacterized protein n=1 Tax=Thiobaca trueperi TaxID=127458 RepID=A0A4R3N1U5_9GAMM|nr:hypothetical protein EDC35_102156 [Thiobaca trueperi]
MRRTPISNASTLTEYREDRLDSNLYPILDSPSYRVRDTEHHHVDGAEGHGANGLTHGKRVAHRESYRDHPARAAEKNSQTPAR